MRERAHAGKQIGRYFLSPGEGGASFSVSCAKSTSCVAVGVDEDGVSENGEEIESPIALVWDGSKWSSESSAAGSPTNLGLTGVACTSATSCMVTGYSFDRIGSPEAYSEIWNGATFKSTKMPTPTGGAELYGVACSSSTACTVVGGGIKGALAEGWNGQDWTVEKAVNPPGSGTTTYLNGVDCSSSSVCTAVGDYSNKAGVVFTLAEAS